MFNDGTIPSWAHMILNVIYSSIGGDQHLTPYSSCRLRNTKKRKGEVVYIKMKAFNNVLSGQRITIERAFGVLIRRFGILWKALEYDASMISKIVNVCASLHNR